MIKLKRCFVLVLSCIMVFTALAFAEDYEALQIKYWNADSSKIMLDFSHEVDLNALENALTVTKDGEEIDFVVEMKYLTSTKTLSEAYSTDKDSVTPLDVNENASYCIIPADGIEFGSGYGFEIKQGLLSVDNSAQLQEDFSKYFTVDKIWKEDFENPEYSSSGPWTGTSGTTISYEDDVFGKAMKVKSTGGIYVRPDRGNVQTTFADTGKTANTLYSSASSEYRKYNNYSVEAKVKFGSISSSHAFIFALQDQTNTANYYYTDFLAVGGGKKSGKPFITSTVSKKLSGSKADLQTIASGANGMTYSTHGIYIDDEFYSEGYNDVSMTVSEDNLRYYLNDDHFLNYDYSLDLTAYGTPGFVFSGEKAGTYYYLDEITVTKVREVVPANYTMTPEDKSTEVPVGNTVRLEFDKPLDSASVNAENIKIYENGKLMSGYSASVDPGNNNAVIIALEKDTKPNREYSVELSEVAFSGDKTSYVFPQKSFHTFVPDIEMADFGISGDADMKNLAPGSYTVSATIKNHSGAETESFIMTICLYDSDYKMIDIDVKKSNLAIGDEATLSAVWEIDKAGEYIAKCYVWRDFVSMSSMFEETID